MQYLHRNNHNNICVHVGAVLHEQNIHYAYVTYL